MAVLRLPSAARTFATALIGRLSYGTVFLSLTLALATGHGSVSRAGEVVAVFAVALAGLAPLRARLIDRHGIRRVLLPLALSYATALVGLAAATWRPATPLWLLELLAVAAGSAAPPLGPTMRTLWRTMCGEDQALMQRAFSLDTVAEEVIGISGPLLVGLLILVANPATGVLLSAVLVAVGTVAMMTSPVIGTVSARAAAQASAGSTEGGNGERRKGSGRTMSRSLSRILDILDPVSAAAGVGIGLGAQSLAIVAFAVRHHQPSAIAWADAGMSAGSILGGLAYGAISWRISSRARLPLLTAALGLSVAVAALAPNVWVLTAITTASGVFVSPLMACAYLVADELADERSRTSAGMWVNNAFNAGSSGGYAAMGPAIARMPLSWCFVVAAAPVVVGAGVAQAWRSRTGSRQAQPLSDATAETEALSV
ncbi:major facilitator superfamily MFS_1 [Catenulispora acidiphila DSM 44928]|uniref:Major facilitator superfamily MFS_1 n=1 Tax=Catenulispora acidiphila (strain DSM 44928 / JCM 14897 / NBRC 102108 / NRRL B-24433 / ID139908) TaxID=479433 RepID=C7Q1B1_CATAD|nr:MFS transporter [Catenulispora acidiphila]ACU73640.1 major facilitator superfamily MFS_1 [Catenulispora acidiphila DSM 44928]